MFPKNPLEMLTPTVAFAASTAAWFLLPRQYRPAAGALAAYGAWKTYEERRLMTRPDLMNGYFKTGGMLSATRGTAQAGALDVAKKRVG